VEGGDGDKEKRGGLKINKYRSNNDYQSPRQVNDKKLTGHGARDVWIERIRVNKRKYEEGDIDFQGHLAPSARLTHSANLLNICTLQIATKIGMGEDGREAGLKVKE